MVMKAQLTDGKFHGEAAGVVKIVVGQPVLAQSFEIRRPFQRPKPASVGRHG